MPQEPAGRAQPRSSVSAERVVLGAGSGAAGAVGRAAASHCLGGEVERVLCYCVD